MTEDDRDEETRLLILVIEGDMLVFLHDSMYVCGTLQNCVQF
jgi:hypothetical protein